MKKVMSKVLGIKRTIGVMAAFLIFVAGIKILNYMYVQPEDWCHVLWHNYYNDQRNIDNLYLGSSHTYHSIQPMMLDEINGRHNFNLATPSQPMNESYYLLKEAEHDNDLEHVYLELFYSLNTDVNQQPPLAEGYGWKNCYEMKLSMNKLTYMFYHRKPEQYVETCLPFVKFRAKLNDWDYIKQQIEYKKSDAYLNYEHYYEDERGQIEYQSAGFYHNTRKLLDSERVFEQNRNLEYDLVSGLTQKYLREIINYCEKEEISLTLFIAPMDYLVLISAQDYDNYVRQIKEIAGEYNVPFYDFNLTKEEYLPIWHGENFNDPAHLSTAGAEMFTPFFYTVVSGEEIENEKYFYDSYAEKMRIQTPRIYGIYYMSGEVMEDEGEPVKRMRIAANREQDMVYRIVLAPENGEVYTIQDFCENTEFNIPLRETGVCTITARMKNTQEAAQMLEIYY